MDIIRTVRAICERVAETAPNPAIYIGPVVAEAAKRGIPREKVIEAMEALERQGFFTGGSMGSEDNDLFSMSEAQWLELYRKANKPGE